MPDFDEDQKELLASLAIPLTDPAAKADVDETATPEPEETPDGKDDKPEAVRAAAPEDAADVGDGEPAAAEADGGAEGTVAGDGGSDGVEPVPAEVPATPAKQPAVTKPAEPEPSPAARRLAEVEAQILADDYDPYSQDGRRLQLEHNRLAAEVVAEPLLLEKRVADAYRPYLAQYPGIEQSQMAAVFDKHVKAYAGKYTGDALSAAATVAMEMELAQIANGQKGAAARAAAPGKQGAKVAAPVAKTPITPKGAIVAPPKSTPTPAAPRRELSDEEELVNFQRQNFPGGLRRTIGR